jgi:hypothetical protein
MKYSIILLVTTWLSQVKTSDVSSSVPELDCRLEWYSSNPRVGLTVGEKGIEPPSRIDRRRCSLRAPSLIGVEPLSQIAGRGVRTKLLCWPSSGKITLSGQWRGRRIRSTKVRTLGGRVLEWVDVIIARCMTASSLNLGRWCQPVSPN